MSNLLSLREEVDRTFNHEESFASSSEDTIQSDSVIYREVRATMAIGGQLNVNFLPQDDVILNKMIEMEAQEYSVMLEREAEG
ncbi:hypothetical protein RHMOL_Rhmol02G0297900 [Rhododendron molle]|uniref:Uncharacterized protein n=1 Tax=Rhododendron molle TaxID=49168 RepID=A0ACC0PX06_RHOML|nr:hypothetical protein RHMOL_Rhmol02G0297900 [Rhododendron molle]